MNTDPNLDNRVTRLEFRADATDKDLQDLKLKDTEMSAALQAIQENLKQIKWIAVGAIGFFVVSQVGILELLKKFVHL